MSSQLLKLAVANARRKTQLDPAYDSVYDRALKTIVDLLSSDKLYYHHRTTMAFAFRDYFVIPELKRQFKTAKVDYTEELILDKAKLIMEDDYSGMYLIDAIRKMMIKKKIPAHLRMAYMLAKGLGIGFINYFMKIVNDTLEVYRSVRDS